MSGEHNDKKTICWGCANACGGCCWSKSFKEVPGWNATPTKIYSTKDSKVDSYIVHKCPMYKKDNGMPYVEEVTLAKLVDMLKITQYRLKQKTDKELIEYCKQRDIKLEIVNRGKKKKAYYIDNFNPTHFRVSREFMELFFGKSQGFTCF